MADSPSSGSIRSAALAHARAGRPVFPCGPDKRPLVASGFKVASTDVYQVRDWWHQWPSALIGMPTGPLSGVWVLDVDVHDGAPGEDSLFALLQAHGKLPDTVEALTASGGRHLYFRWDAKRPVRNSAGKLGEGLDVRGEGGYVIVPPSRLPDGRAYEWEGSSDPADGVRAAAAPDWLLDLVAPVRSAQTDASERGSPNGFVSRAQVESALQVLDPDCSYDDWLTVGMGLQSTGQDWALEVWDAWSATGTKYAGRDALVEKWNSFSQEGNAAGSIGIGSLFALAKAAGWVRRVTRTQGPVPPGPPVPPQGDETPPDEGPARPVIEIRDGELPRVVSEGEQALMASGAHIFVHGTRLVRVGVWEAAPGRLVRSAGAAVLFELGPHWLQERLTLVADWMRWDKRSADWVRKNAPRDVADKLLARQGEWKFSRLAGFVESPTLTPDGRVISNHGYDRESGLYVTCKLPLDPIDLPAETRKVQAAEAAELLYSLVDTFTFETPADRSAALALMMTGVLRRVLPAAPLGAISASTPGTGKSLLAKCIAMVSMGREPSAMSLGPDEREMENRLDAALLDADPLILIDNISRAVRSDALNTTITEPARTCRVLGYSRKVEAPTNVLFLLTGNNLTVLGDLARRTLMLRLDSEVERPEEREFVRSENEQLEYVRERRAEAVRAVILIALAYQQAGCPDVGIKPYGSFGLWDRMVRRPLCWVGQQDPLAASRELREEDHEFTGMRSFLESWMEVFGTSPVTANEVWRKATTMEKGFDGSLVPECPMLHEAMTAILGSGTKGGGVRELGYKLRSWQRRIVGNCRIVKEGTDNKGVKWRVESLK